MPHRAASKRASGMRSAAALFAACRVRCAYGSVAARNRVELLRGEVRVAVGGREMRHEPDDVRGRLRQLREPPASHPRVELEMDGDVGRDLAFAGDGQLEPRFARVGDPLRRPHHEDPRLGERAPQLERFVDRSDTEHRRARLERRPPDVDRAMPVAVRLDDSPELGPVERLEQPASVVPDRPEVDRDLAAMHCRQPKRGVGYPW